MSFTMTAVEVRALGGPVMMACLDCVAAAALADGQVGPKERERLKKIVGSVPWTEAGIPEFVVQSRLDQTEKKLQGFTSKDQVLGFIKECAKGIPQSETRQAVLYLMAAVAHADGQVNEAEQLVLGNYALAFDIGMQTVQQIANAARSAKF